MCTCIFPFLIFGYLTNLWSGALNSCLVPVSVSENGDRMLAICLDAIPIFLPTEWVVRTYRNLTFPYTAMAYARAIVVFFRWLYRRGKPLEQFNRTRCYEFRNALELAFDHDGYLFVKTEICATGAYTPRLRCITYAKAKSNCPVIYENPYVPMLPKVINSL